MGSFQGRFSPGSWFDDQNPNRAAREIKRELRRPGGHVPPAFLSLERRKKLEGNKYLSSTVPLIESQPQLRVYFPAVGKQQGRVGWVEASSTFTKTEVYGLAEKGKARRLAKSLREFLGASVHVQIHAPPVTGGESWGLALAVAIYSQHHDIPLSRDAYSGILREADGEFTVRNPGMIPMKKECIEERELPCARLVYSEQNEALEAWLAAHIQLPEWSTEPVGDRFRILLDAERDRERTSKLSKEEVDHCIYMMLGHLRPGEHPGLDEHFDPQILIELLKAHAVTLLRGVSGMGKSVRAMRVAREWHQTVGPVVYLSMGRAMPEPPRGPENWPAVWAAAQSRDLAGSTPSWRLLESILHRGWQRENGHGGELLVVLDGLDEALRRGSLDGPNLTTLLGALGSARVLLTSQPSAFEALKDQAALKDLAAVVTIFVPDPRQRPLCRDHAARLGYDATTVPSRVLLEQVLQGWEIEHAEIGFLLHRIGSALTAYPILPHLGRLVGAEHWRFWEREYQRRSGRTPECDPQDTVPPDALRHRWEGLGILEKAEWCDAIRLWWLREQAELTGRRTPETETRREKRDDPLSWIALPPIEALRKLMPIWNGPDALFEVWDHLLHPSRLPAGWKVGRRRRKGQREQAVLIDHKGRHVLRLRNHPRPEFDHREPDGRWSRSPLEQRRVRNADDLWRKILAAPTADSDLYWHSDLWYGIRVPLAESIGWILARTIPDEDVIMDFAIEHWRIGIGSHEFSKGIIAGLLAYSEREEEEPNIDLAASLMTFGWFADFRFWEENFLGTEEGQALIGAVLVQANPSANADLHFWHDLDTTLRRWVEDHREGYTASWPVFGTMPRPRFGDLAVEDDWSPSLDTPLGPLCRLLSAIGTEHFPSEFLEDVTESVSRALLRLAFVERKQPGHHSYLSEGVEIADLQDPLGNPELAELLSWIETRRDESTLIERLWAICRTETCLSELLEPVENDGPLVDTANAGGLAALLNSLEEDDELEPWFDAIIGDEIPDDPAETWSDLLESAGAALELASPSFARLMERSNSPYELWLERCGEAELLDFDLYEDEPFLTMPDRWTPELILHFFKGETVTAILSRIPYPAQLRVTGRMLALPCVKVAEEMLEELLNMVQETSA